jgi:hypothetical protein
MFTGAPLQEYTPIDEVPFLEGYRLFHTKLGTSICFHVWFCTFSRMTQMPLFDHF